MSTAQERLAEYKRRKDPMYDFLQRISTLQGSPGYIPIKGKDYFTEEEIQSVISFILSQVKDGYTPIKGVDYFDGEDAYTPIKGVDYFDGKPGKSGYTPIKGIDYDDGKPGKPGKDGISPKVKDIVSELRKNPIEYKDIKDAPDLTDLPKLIEFLRLGGFRGGGSSVSSSAASGYQAPLSGGLTGTNTWTTAPNVIVVDGAPKQKVSTDGTVNWTGTTTTVLAVVPTFDVFSSS